MATVRMTKELKERITDKAIANFRVRMNANTQRFHQMIDFDELRRDIIETVLDDYGLSEEMYKAVPSGWFPEVHSFSLSELNGHRVHHVINEVSCPRPMAVPHALIKDSYARSFKFNAARFDKYVEIVRQHDESHRAIDNEKSEFMNSLRALLAKCNTLKQALDLFPNLERLVPESVMNEHRKVPEKRQKWELTADDLNLDGMAASLVRARLHDVIS